MGACALATLRLGRGGRHRPGRAGGVGVEEGRAALRLSGGCSSSWVGDGRLVSVKDVDPGDWRSGADSDPHKEGLMLKQDGSAQRGRVQVLVVRERGGPVDVLRVARR